MRFIGESVSVRTILTKSLLAAVFLVLAGTVGVAEAKLVKEKSHNVEQGPDGVFAAIAEAWENGDMETLAGLVHEDGLRVTNGEYDRFTNYSPSQSFYYFKNQFRVHSTVSFTFERLQDSQGGHDRVHGMVVWNFRKANETAVQEIKLVLVLARQGETWRLSEINTITIN